MKVEYGRGEAVEEFDGLNLLKNEKGLEYGEALNGIAYSGAEGKFLVTGKNWGWFYEIIL